MKRNLLILAAAINLSVGVFLASQPSRARDFQTVRGWTTEWLLTGHNVYGSQSSRTDYPPHALVALSPFALLPEKVALPVWASFNICLALVAPYLAMRFIAPRTKASEIVLMAGLFLCWSGTKTLLQFTLLMLVLALMSGYLAERRPHLSAIYLALASMKPQVAGPFILWMLVARHWKIVLESMLIVAGLILVFCIRAQVSPISVGLRYFEIVGGLHSGREAMVGASDIRSMFVSFLPGAADGLAVAIGLVSLGALVFFAPRLGRWSSGAKYVGLSMGAVWMLMNVYHLTYGFVILLPTAVLLFCCPNQTDVRLHRSTFWSLQAALIVDVPGVWRRVHPRFPGIPFDSLFAHFDQLFMLCLFVALCTIAWRRTGPTTCDQATP